MTNPYLTIKDCEVAGCREAGVFVLVETGKGVCAAHARASELLIEAQAVARRRATHGCTVSRNGFEAQDGGHCYLRAERTRDGLIRIDRSPRLLAVADLVALAHWAENPP